MKGCIIKLKKKGIKGFYKYYIIVQSYAFGRKVLEEVIGNVDYKNSDNIGIKNSLVIIKKRKINILDKSWSSI